MPAKYTYRVVGVKLRTISSAIVSRPFIGLTDCYKADDNDGKHNPEITVLRTKHFTHPACRLRFHRAQIWPWL